MWQPDPSWESVAAGASPSTYGVWTGVRDHVAVVIKRVVPPGPDDHPLLSNESSPQWWRREVEVALAGVVGATVGLRSPRVVAVEEDAEGVTLFHERVVGGEVPGLFIARSVGRFAANPIPEVSWLARDLVRRRLALVEERGGWGALPRTPLADIADHLWQHRESLLADADESPLVLAHGDPARGNFVAHDPMSVDPTTVAIDWAQWGTSPAGTDLGLLALGSREAFEPLAQAYAEALPPGLATDRQVVRAASVAVAFTALTRADWALARVAPGEGPLAAKFRHPAVAVHLRALQRHFPQLESLT